MLHILHCQNSHKHTTNCSVPYIAMGSYCAYIFISNVVMIFIYKIHCSYDCDIIIILLPVIKCVLKFYANTMEINVRVINTLCMLVIL